MVKGLSKGVEESRKLREIVRDENQKLIDEFSDYLREVKGLSERTVEDHAFNLRMLNHYLAGYESARLEEATSDDVSFFMNDWYIRKAASRDETVHRMPVSLEKFFTFLSDEKGFDVALGEIEEVCSDRELFKERLREWMDPGVIDGWWTTPR
ncbi:hypothetical protein AKJ61_03470 [candidate division MSBL1 archaeon SCGC-AAA259B11]|nr:hypothetical protein AKJ61_03470 [candidate division MSBL1 archaeon SCGC-AAA259B11]